jgi:hypothetical protein
MLERSAIMRKPIVFLLAGCAVAVTAALLQAATSTQAAQVQPPASAAPSVDRPHESSVASERPAAGPAGSTGGADPAAGKQAQAGAALTDEEEALLGMYAEMGQVLEKHASDCGAMASAVGAIITAYEEDVQQVVAAAAQRGAQEARQADERLEAVAGEQLRRFRGLASKAMKTCSNELMPELRRLSSIQGNGQK